MFHFALFTAVIIVSSDKETGHTNELRMIILL